MRLKVLIVPDKFKGSLTAEEAARAIARGWQEARPDDVLEVLPMSDGGDGFGAVFGSLVGASPQTIKTVDAAHRPVESNWWWHPESRTAVVESARTIGLAMLPKAKYHPFELDTFGLGEVLRAVGAAGAKCCLLGIGGSATNDGGFGMARALGWQFYNAHDEEITRWTELHRLFGVRRPEQQQLAEELVVAVDVQNPLLGPNGCSRVYGPQKGLKEFEFADRCLGQMAAVIDKQWQVAHAEKPGAGAAGGLGYGLLTFAKARTESGFAMFERHARLAERIRTVDLVITGEGALDAQSMMGKGVGEVANLSGRLGVPCVGVAGVIRDRDRVQEKFRELHALVPELTNEIHALREAPVWLERLATKAAAAAG